MGAPDRLAITTHLDLHKAVLRFCGICFTVLCWKCVKGMDYRVRVFNFF